MIMIQNIQPTLAASSTSPPRTPEPVSAVAAIMASPEVSKEVLPEPTPPQDNATREQELKSTVSDLNRYIQNQRSDLKFEVDDESGQLVVKVVDTQTNEIIRQFPREEMLVLARRLEESTGLLLRTRA